MPPHFASCLREWGRCMLIWTCKKSIYIYLWFGLLIVCFRRWSHKKNSVLKNATFLSYVTQPMFFSRKNLQTWVQRDLNGDSFVVFWNDHTYKASLRTTDLCKMSICSVCWLGGGAIPLAQNQNKKRKAVTSTLSNSFAIIKKKENAGNSCRLERQNKPSWLGKMPRMTRGF